MIRAELLIEGIGELATLEVGPVPRVGPAMSEVGRIANAVLAVDGGRVVFAGPAARARGEVRGRARARRLDADGGTVVPGFVDAHTHALFGGDRHGEVADRIAGRSYGEIAARGGGILSTVRATRAASDRELLTGTAVRLGRFAEGGSTTVEIKSGYDLTVPGELRLLRLLPRLARATGLRIVPTFLGAHAVPPEFEGRTDAYVDRLIRDALPEIARDRLARFCDVFCEPGYFTVDQSARLLRAAAALGLGLKVHADEFALAGGSRLAAELSARSADHLLCAGPPEFEALARAGVTAVVLPMTAFAARTAHAPPGRALVDAGVPVALGSDASPSAWVDSMPVVLAHAVFAARLTPAEALTAATVNAAHASGVAEEAGRIAVGRPAEFALFDLPSVDHLGYRIGQKPAVVYRQRKLGFSR